MKNKLLGVFAILLSTCTIYLIHYAKEEKELEKTYKLGQYLYDKGEVQKAERQFQSIHNRRKFYRSTSLYLGKIYYYDKKFLEAYSTFLEDWQKDNSRLYVLEWVIKSGFIVKKDPKELTEFCTIYLNQNPTNPEILYLFGILNESQGQWELAIKNYEKALSSSDSILLTLNRLHSIYKKSGLDERNSKYEEMIRAIKKFQSKKEGKDS